MIGGGRWLYLTGGTTANPRIVEYDRERWAASIAAKLRLFELYAVGPSSRVAVAFPFAPWAIGSIFAEAAFLAEATVLPLGLSALEDPFSSVLSEFRPTHLCGSGAVLARLGRKQSDRLNHRVDTLFVAGEKLTTDTRNELISQWDAQVVDIYGMAEFDMVAAQVPGLKDLALIPHLQYWIATEQEELLPLATGCEGELWIAELEAGPRHATGDLVRVKSKADHWRNGLPSYAIEIIGRIDGAVSFADGSMLAPVHLQATMNRFPSISALQAVVRRRVAGDELELRYVSAAGGAEMIDHNALCKALLDAAIDVQDSLRHGVITKFHARAVAADALSRTARGKIPAILLEPEECGHV